MLPVVSERCLNKNNTHDLDVSEVFDWSDLKMLSTSEYPISLSVVCERCLNKNNTPEISRDVSEVFDWTLKMLSTP